METIYFFHLSFPRNFPITHTQTYKSTLKNRSEGNKEKSYSVPKGYVTFCYPALTHTMRNSTHRISFIQHLVSAKPAVDFQISRSVTFWQVTFIPLILGWTRGMALFLCFTTPKKSRLSHTDLLQACLVTSASELGWKENTKEKRSIRILTVECKALSTVVRK